VGPAGSGKSSIATAYATAAAKRGQKSAIFNFDETLSTIYRRSEQLGGDLRAMVQGETIKITQLDPAELSPGQFVDRVRRAVETDGARLIVIDSLNGFLNAMSGEQMLVSQMHELLTFLNQHGVVTLLVLTLAGMLGPNMSVPVDISYLSDNVLVLRYFESGGRLRKAISVVKKRSGAHEDTIHELSFSSKGIEIGEPLTEFRGVMTGVPTLISVSKDEKHDG
jgi:circadian clock protein KaiC